MRDTFFSFLVQYHFDLTYRQLYRQRMQRFCLLFSWALFIISAGCLLAVPYCSGMALPMSLIALCAQLIQAFRQELQTWKRADALKYITQDMDRQFVEIENCWQKNESANLSDTEISDQISAFKIAHCATFNRFAADIIFPDRKRLKSKAAEKTKAYIAYRYGVELKDVNEHAEKQSK